MKFIKGNPKSPSGTLIAFSEVKGYNPFEPNAKILAVQIVVSPLNAHSYNYPVVVFPVATFSDKKEFFRVVEFLGNCDVIQLEDFKMPEGGNEKEYIKKRRKMLNALVQEYVEAFQKKYALQIQEQDLAIFDYSFDLDGMSLPFKKVSAPKLSNKKKKVEEKDLDLRDALEQLDQLLQKKRKRRGRSKSSKTKEENQNHIEEFQPYITFIKTHHPEIDIINFERAIESKDYELANLYIQKYYAIMDERYETAQYFHNRIKELEIKDKK